MPYTMDDFRKFYKKYVKEHYLHEYTAEERMEGLSSEERVKDLSVEELERLLQQKKRKVSRKGK